MKSQRQESLSQKIYFLLAIISLTILVLAISLISRDEEQLAEELVAENIEAIAQNYFDSINTMMLTGTMANRNVIQQKLLSQANIIEARIIRGEKVVALFGEGNNDQKAQNQIEREALNGRTSYRIIEKDGIRQAQFLMPLLAKEDYRGTNCLACHNAQENDVLGVVKIAYDLTSLDKKITASVTRIGLFLLLVLAIGFGLLSFALYKLVFYRLKRISRNISNLAETLDLSEEIPIYRNDELSAVSKALNHMLHNFKISLESAQKASTDLIEMAKSVDDIASVTHEAVEQQKSGTEMVAAAINELDASATEVENNTKSTAEKSKMSAENAEKGRMLAEKGQEGINYLSSQVHENAEQLQALNGKVGEVDTVLDVITSIAEQTNLLALNAAIEAARAGEQGRGFAVVADEVRSLANRTRESIEQVHNTIEELKSMTHGVVDSMQQVTTLADEKAKDVESVTGVLIEISEQIILLDELNFQIADSARQQNQAAAEINTNITQIADTAHIASDDAIKGKSISEQLIKLSIDLQQQVNRFKL